MIHSGVKKIIENNAIGMATVDVSGKPHNIAVACCKVFGNKIIISNVHIKKSIENIEKNNFVSLVAWNKEWEKACIGFEIVGTAKSYSNGKWFEFVKKLPDNKDCIIKSAIIITIKKINKLLA